MRGNILHAELKDGSITSIGPLFQYDYGQKILFSGVELPFSYEVHFSNSADRGNSVTMIGNAEGVEIPDAVLLTGDTVHVWVYLHSGDSDGETEYHCQILVRKRAKPTNDTPTPVQQDVITQAIAALDAAVAQTGEDVIATGQAKDAAEAAQGKAEDAQAAAETAQGKAEDAQQAAETAQGAAETAQGKAEDAQEAAETAQGKAEGARDWAFSAAEDAADSAERAEQAAANAGYMFFFIDENGDLIYQRTPNTQVDFELVDGDLYVMGVS